MREEEIERYGLKVGQEITWRYEHRGGYGFITMVRATIIKLNPKKCRIEAELKKAAQNR